jgi:hypothetical protein
MREQWRLEIFRKRCWGYCLDLQGRKLQKTRKNLVLRKLKNFTDHYVVRRCNNRWNEWGEIGREQKTKQCCSLYCSLRGTDGLQYVPLILFLSAVAIMGALWHRKTASSENLKVSFIPCISTPVFHRKVSKDDLHLLSNLYTSENISQYQIELVLKYWQFIFEIIFQILQRMWIF